jgi:hypothetical protein
MKQKTDPIDVLLSAVEPDAAPAAKAVLLNWSRGQLKLRRKQLKAGKTRLVRTAAALAVKAGDAALKAHRDHADKYVTKVEGVIRKLESIYGAVSPKV